MYHVSMQGIDEHMINDKMYIIIIIILLVKNKISIYRMEKSVIGQMYRLLFCLMGSKIQLKTPTKHSTVRVHGSGCLLV